MHTNLILYLCFISFIYLLHIWKEGSTYLKINFINFKTKIIKNAYLKGKKYGRGQVNSELYNKGVKNY